jgi:hypothetical protein
MGTIFGVIVGYALGTQAGKDGWKELKDAWATIRSSEEVRDLLSGGMAIVGQLLERGSGLAGEVLRAKGGDELRRAA